ncbi:MAG: hypothetical protein KC800_21365 [Candidatus Eremiobacteraeota bacterium]|nr:hypothetical protein [Candidatus Eremiobacteraeota bacterium]
MKIGPTTHISRPRPSVSTGQTERARAVDVVQWSGQNNSEFRPAAFLNRASGEYLALVPTHPSDRDEFVAGVEQIQSVVAEAMYGGRWPEDSELPSLPAQGRPGDPARNGGQTMSEQLVANDLIALYREVAPHVQHNPQMHQRLASSIHVCQSGLQSRVLRRDYPDYYFSLPGSLQQDAEREAARWGRFTDAR